MYFLIISKSNLVLNRTENIYIINERSLYLLFICFCKRIETVFLSNFITCRSQYSKLSNLYYKKADYLQTARPNFFFQKYLYNALKTFFSKALFAE